jgi:hypothetical protein
MSPERKVRQGLGESVKGAKECDIEMSDILEKGSDDVHFARTEPNYIDTLNYARILFDLREYKKCMYFSKPYASAKYQSALFIHYYSMFLLAMAQNEEQSYSNYGLITLIL